MPFYISFKPKKVFHHGLTSWSGWLDPGVLCWCGRALDLLTYPIYIFVSLDEAVFQSLHRPFRCGRHTFKLFIFFDEVVLIEANLSYQMSTCKVIVKLQRETGFFHSVVTHVLTLKRKENCTLYKKLPCVRFYPFSWINFFDAVDWSTK
jgi:hypothetical protein